MQDRINRCLPNSRFATNQLHSERVGGHDHRRIAFGMSDMGVGHDNRNVDGFGGVPFYVHKGTMCHRGANPFKKADFHPSETVKRVIYREDGSGRDTYIATNNGGLTVQNQIATSGTDQHAIYASALRGYGKDTVSPGYQRVPAALRIADEYIYKKLSYEDADYAKRHAKHLKKIM